MATEHPVHERARPGGPLPRLVFERVDGDAIDVGGPRERWTLLVVYRGRHCGRCKRYLNRLETMKADWEAAGFDIVAVSADTAERARADVEEFGWSFPVAHGLDAHAMRALSLYVSDPLDSGETDRPFAEPGTFCVRPDGTIQIVSISNGPAARTDLDELLDGMVFTIEHDKPARGTAGG